MEHLASEIERYGLPFVFVNVLLAEAGLPLPLFPILLAAGALVTGGGDRVIGLIAAGVGGFLAADLAWYWCGKRYGGRVLGWLCKLSLSPDHCVRHLPHVMARAKRLLGDENRWPELHAKFPAGRAGKASEIAEAVVFLASDRAGFISGATIEVDGGHSVHRPGA